VGSDPDRVKPKTIKLVFVASQPCMQLYVVRTRTGRLGITCKLISITLTEGLRIIYNGLIIHKMTYLTINGKLSIAQSKLTPYSKKILFSMFSF
jgi:hypothetical protein